ncbi:MAG: RNA polymerase sigma factor [Victivallaceae bacterium]|nr:RNA polymerase sigma factor [Victivallaceae bacterium]
MTAITPLPRSSAGIITETEMSALNPDTKVIISVLNGNTDDFIVLVNKYRIRILTLIAKRIPVNDIEDVAQETFIRAFKNLNSFSREKPFESWLSIITLRTCCDYWRKNSRRKEFFAPSDDPEHLKWLELIAVETAAAEHKRTVSNKEVRELLDWTLGKLSAEDRALIEMIYFEGRSIKETAAVLNWGSSNTKVRAMRARSRMRRILTRLFEAQG